MSNILQSYFAIKREQKPINQSFELQNSIFFFKDFKRDSKYLLSLFLLLNFLYELIVKEKILPLIFIICLFFFSFSNLLLWKNLFKIFYEEKIYYEESSWFDSKTWPKPIFFLKNDRIFVNENIKQNISLILQILLVQIFLSILFYFLN